MLCRTWQASVCGHVLEFYWFMRHVCREDLASLRLELCVSLLKSSRIQDENQDSDENQLENMRSDIETASFTGQT